jgi:hypothetical protein
LKANHKGSSKSEVRRKSELAILIGSDFEFRISGFTLRFAFGLAEASDAVAFFPLAAFFEDFEALKALQDIPFSAQSGSCAQAAML